MPADYCPGLDDVKGGRPVFPGLREENPEEAVEFVEARPGSGAFEYCELLSEGEVFQGQVSSVFQQ